MTAHPGPIRHAWWTIDSGGTFATCPPFEHILGTAKSAKGGVILLHDRRNNSVSHARYVLEMTDRLLKLLHIEWIQIMRMNVLFSDR